MTRLEPGTVLDGIDRDGAARLIVGTPGSGKTEFALSVLMAGLRRYGGTQAVMAVSGRVAADALGNRVIRELGFSVQARPVTTLGAVAFRAISASREGTGLPSPRLLNGAEQDALLRQVMAVHLRHAVAGDDCGTCDLLRVYFARMTGRNSYAMPVPARCPALPLPHNQASRNKGRIRRLRRRQAARPARIGSREVFQMRLSASCAICWPDWTSSV